MLLRIDDSALVKYTRDLEQVHRSALPNAIRSTLNDTAMDVKKVTMPKTSKEEFIERKATFLKSSSRVEFARGYSIADMKAIVGFIPKPGDTSHAVEDLEQQEEGGDIDGRSFIALKEARTSRAWSKMVKSGNRLSKIRKEIFNSGSKNLHGVKSGKEAFTISAIYAGKGGFVLGNEKNAKGNRFLYYINSVKKVDGQTKVNSTAVYAVKSKRKAEVKATRFMRRASINSAGKMPMLFKKHAEIQLRRVR